MAYFLSIQYNSILQLNYEGLTLDPENLLRIGKPLVEILLDLVCDAEQDVHAARKVVGEAE